MTETRKGIFGQTSIAFWTIVGSIATIVGVLVALFAPIGAGTDDKRSPESEASEAIPSILPPPQSTQPTISPTTTVSTATTLTAVPPTPGQGPGTPICGSSAVTAKKLVTPDSPNVSINGKTALCAFIAGYLIDNYSHISQGTIDVNLGRQYATVKARIGITDGSYANQQVHVQVFADGNSIYNRTFVLGQSDDVTLAVTGVLRLSFMFEGELTRANAAVGDPIAFA